MEKNSNSKINNLLSREKFKELVFKRDKNKCVICCNQAVDAHHIIDRKLFNDGGYYLNNGASVCNDCHYKCEQTLISCEELRLKCNIKDIILPNHFDRDCIYDKWGNIILENLKLKGEMFYTEHVQKILMSANKLDEFSDKRMKYPRTFHFPWSEGLQNDDKKIETLSYLESCDDVVVTLKLDGENTSMYNDYIHARSINMNQHDSRNWVKALHATIKDDIPDNFRLCGENMFAKHSIHYNNLESYFYLFSIWESDVCLSWDETVKWAQLLGLITAPVLYRGKWDEQKIKSLFSQYYNGNEMEGYVVRFAESFKYSDFKYKVAKEVRKSHIQTDEHWMSQEIIQNKLC